MRSSAIRFSTAARCSDAGSSFISFSATCSRSLAIRSACDARWSSIEVLKPGWFIRFLLAASSLVLSSKYRPDSLMPRASPVADILFKNSNTPSPGRIPPLNASSIPAAAPPINAKNIPAASRIPTMPLTRKRNVFLNVRNADFSSDLIALSNSYISSISSGEITLVIFAASSKPNLNAGISDPADRPPTCRSAPISSCGSPNLTVLPIFLKMSSARSVRSAVMFTPSRSNDFIICSFPASASSRAEFIFSINPVTSSKLEPVNVAAFSNC